MKTYQELLEGEWNDMQAFMPLLKELGGQVTHITEFGVRHCFSTVAFLEDFDGEYVGYDIKRFPEHEDLEHRDNVRFIYKDTLKIRDIAETDILLIDTLHTAQQVKGELRFAHRVRKYLVFHDLNEHPRNGLVHNDGVRGAIQKFLKKHKEWRVHTFDETDCGLCVLERVP